ncbi:scavenger receptor cysteine-rich domain superfamily protein-like [Diadema antillarum]
MVHVYASDAWRSVCSDTWNMDYGQALCRELLYPGLLQNLYRDSSGSEEPASIGNLTCKNNAEPTLSECSASVSPTGCPTGYAWVECQPAARFASSTNVSGAVEVYHDGQWRFMCYGSGDSAIRDANAKLACRMMGHPDSQVLGPGSLNITDGFLGMSYTCSSPSSSSRDERDLRFCKSDRHDNCTMVLRIACASPSDPFYPSSDISDYRAWSDWSDWSDVDATTTPSTSTVFLHDSTPRDVRISNRHSFQWS